MTCWETPHYEASLIDYTAFPATYRYAHTHRDAKAYIHSHAYRDTDGDALRDTQ